MFLRPVRRGLQHIEIFATPDQCEPLLTVMNTATNPRTRTGSAEGSDGAHGEGGDGADDVADSGDGPAVHGTRTAAPGPAAGI